MTRFDLTIDGKPDPGSGTFGVIDPATAKEFARAPRCDGALLDRAMLAAARAQPSWARDEAIRRTVLAKIAAILRDNADPLAELLTREQGKPVSDAKGEILASAHYFDFFSELEFGGSLLQDDEKGYVELTYRALGVVAAITPWNYPIVLASFKIAPSLLAGNTVVLKPSPYTPLTTLRLGELVRDHMPPGVVNIVSGDDELGAAMTTHTTPAKLSFTGSTSTGLKVADCAARRLRHVTLELGGNDAAVVLDDVDVAKTAENLFWGAFKNNGQVCTAIKRVYVPERLLEPILERLVELAGQARIGGGFEPGVQLGPLNNEPQLRRVTDLVEAARLDGAAILAGGAPLNRSGYFYPPTIVRADSDRMALVAEEQFGPALPVLSYSHVDEAVARANATDFGLSGSVWSGDPDHAAAVAARLECGTAWVNTHGVLGAGIPFGGHKLSGYGVENGLLGLLQNMQVQVLHRSPASLAS